MSLFRASSVGLMVALSAASAVSCASGGRHDVSPVARSAATEKPWCGRMHPGKGALPLGDVRQSSTVALVHDGARRLAYVADADDATVHVVDLDTNQETSAALLDGAPSQLVVAPDGRVIVGLRDKGSLEVLEPAVNATLEKRCIVETPEEPVALAISPDSSTVLVTTGWGHKVSAFDARTMEARWDAEVPREPRAIVVSDDGKKAFVSHAVGAKLSVVELEHDHAVREIPMVAPDLTSTRRRFFPRMPTTQTSAKPMPMPIMPAHVVTEKSVRTACQGFALAKSIAPEGRILAPQVLVDSGDTQERASGYGTANGTPTEVGDVAVIDAATDTPFEASLRVQADPGQSLGMAGGERGCLLPRAAAMDEKRHELLVTCLGSDSLVAYDASSAEPQAAMLASWHVGSGPVGVAVDAEKGRAVVFAQFDRTIHVVALAPSDAVPAEDTPSTRIALSRRPTVGSVGDVALGRRLFHSSGDQRISSDGRACASCHPDGRDDSLTWSTPDGPRNTPVLAGRLAGTAPYAWSGTGDSVKGHLTHTFQRLRGAGLRGEELDALVAYVTTMAPPPAKPMAASTAKSASDEEKQRARGEAIFHSSEAACSSCHGKGGVAPDGELHDVGSGATADSKKDFDTPSLRYVGGSAPYFHDGRYATLHELLTKNDGMGKTSQLSPADVDALEAYVRSL